MIGSGRPELVPKAGRRDDPGGRTLSTAAKFVHDTDPVLLTEYAVLASYAFILLYTVFSLLSGRVADTTSRPKTLAVASAAWSLAVLASCDIFVYMH